MPDEEIAVLEAALREAQLSADIEALDRLISDDLLFTGPDGTLATKADDLSSYRNGIVRFTTHDPDELRVRRVGANVAIAALRTRLEGTVAGTAFAGVFRYTRIWSREETGNWQIVAGHVSAVPAND
jgi:ketosteroid isomerase-like protein